MPTIPSAEPAVAQQPSSPASADSSPYVGPRPFLPADGPKFFGRNRELLDLKYRVMAHPITLLYSMSGAGKTSLINAKLVPALQKERCVVLPVARVRGATEALDTAEIPNIYVFHALMSWQFADRDDLPHSVKDRTLKDELTAHSGRNCDEDEGRLLVAIFDQFEELFTAYSSRWGDRQGFFEQLSDALESIPNLRVLIAMREDYLAAMDPYARLVPEKLRTRFRLERLRRESAIEAVVKPLDGTGRAFDAGVAEQLVDGLMAIRIRPRRELAGTWSDNVAIDLPTAAGDPANRAEVLVLPTEIVGVRTAEYVEPVQLQVVCQNLWASLQPGERLITAGHLESFGDANQALSRFYEDCIKEAVELAKVREGVVRRWFAERLITPAGTRGLFLRGPARTGGLPNEVVDQFESRHLVRGEDRGGARWYELSHDRFIEPIVNSNRRWQNTRPSLAIWSKLKERAAAWDAAPHERKPSLLLDKADLLRAEAWKKSTDSDELGVSDQVKRLLDESVDAVKSAEMAAQFEAERDAAKAAEMAAQLETERRQAKEEKARLRRLLAGVLAVVLVILVALGGAIKSQRNAEVAAEKERVAREFAVNQKQLADDAAHAAQVSERRAGISNLGIKATAEPQRPSLALKYILQAMTLAKNEIGWSFDEQHNTSDLIRGTLSRIYQRSQVGGQSQELTDIAFAPRDWGKAFRADLTPVVALGGNGGRVELWDLHDYDDPTDDRPLVPPIKLDLPSPGKKDRWITRIAFNPKGPMLAIASGDTSSIDPRDRGGAWVWTAPKAPGGQGQLRLLESDPDSGPVADVAFSPDGTLVATAGSRKLGSGSKPSVDGFWSGTVRVYDAKTIEFRPLRAFPFKGPAQSVAFDRRGERLVVASGDRNGNNPDLPGRVVVVDLKNWRSAEMEDYDHPSIEAVFSPDGTVVVSGGIDGIGRVHDPATGRLIATLVGHSQPITALKFSHDGTRLVTASGDRSARIWNPPSWSAYRAGESSPAWSSQVILVGHMNGLLSAEFSFDGTLVLTGSSDRTARVWDAQTGECLATHVGNEGAVNAARFLTRGLLLATAGSDMTARVWTTGVVETSSLMLASRDVSLQNFAGHTTLQPVAGRPGEGPLLLTGHEAALRDVEFRPGKEGRYQALTAGADGVACLWDVAGFAKPGLLNSPRRRFEPSPRSPLTDLAFSPDGERMATASVDGMIRVWEVESGTKLKLIQSESGANAGAALGLTFSPKGTYLLTSWADEQMRLFRNNGNDSTPVAVWPGSASRLTPQLFDKDERFVVTPNAGLLRVKGQSGSVTVWDVAKKQMIQKLDNPEGGLGPVADLAVSPKTGHIAAATMGTASGVVVWEANSPYTRTGRPLRHPAGVERLAFKPDGTALATAAEDGMGRIWDWPLRDGQAPEIIPGLTGPAPVLAYGNDGYHLLSDAGATIGQIWDPSGKTAVSLKAPRNRIMAVAFRAGDSPEVLSVNHQNRFQRWSLKDDEKGEPLGSCRGPNLTPTAVALHPGGNLAASGTESGALKLWSTEMGDEIVEVKIHKHRVNSLAFSADGSRLVSADRDGLTCVWSLFDLDGPKLDSSGRSARVAPTPLASFTHDGQPVTVARFLDRQGQTVITGTGNLNRVRWQPEPEMNSEAFAYRLDLSSPRPRAEKLVAVKELKRDNTAEDLPIGLLAAAVSPRDGRVFLGTGGRQNIDNLVRTFDQPTDNRQKDMSLYLGHTGVILDLAVSPDGKYLATASVDNTARVWEIPNRKDSQSVELRGHTGDVASVIFSPDSHYVLTISRQDGTARVWDRDGGDPLYILGTRRAGLNSATLNDPPGPRQYTDDVVAAAFSPDGKLLVTAQGDGNARIYRLDLCGEFDALEKLARRRSEGFKNKPAVDP